MAKLSDEDKKIIDDMYANDKSLAEIKRRFDGVSYVAIWNYVHRDIVQQRNKKRWADKPKSAYLPSTQQYVPTGKPMPPTNPPKPMTIIVDKELAELACKQMGLGPPVTTLANRPHNISHSGMKYIDGKWVANQDFINYGIVDYSAPVLRSNT